LEQGIAPICELYAIQIMPVPDSTYFGDKPGGGGFTYGEARKLTDNDRKIEILKLRLDSFLISQVKSLTEKTPDDTYKIWSPFPLTVMTLLSIETLGHVIGDVKEVKKKHEQEFSKKIATPIYKLTDKRLSDGISKKFHAAFKALHGKEDKKALNVYSDIIHKYQRNTFTHGYQAKGVYLSHQLDVPWAKDEALGFLTINPYMFWDLFECTFKIVFEKISINKEPKWRKNALSYFDALLE